MDGYHIHVHFGTTLYGNDTYGNDTVANGSGNATSPVYFVEYGNNHPARDSSRTSQNTIHNVVTGTDNGTANMEILDGYEGDDTLFGYGGGDILVGGLGRDKLFGGVGADSFVFYKTEETGITSETRDIIADFKSSEGDKIDLIGIDANVSLTGDQAFTFIGTAEFSSNATGQLRFDPATHILYGSTNADNTPEFSIELTGVSSLSVSNFYL